MIQTTSRKLLLLVAAAILATLALAPRANATIHGEINAQGQPVLTGDAASDKVEMYFYLFDTTYGYFDLSGKAHYTAGPGCLASELGTTLHCEVSANFTDFAVDLGAGDDGFTDEQTYARVMPVGLRLSSGPGNDTVNLSTTFAAVDGDEGNDAITLSSPYADVASGGPGDDHVRTINEGGFRDGRPAEADTIHCGDGTGTDTIEAHYELFSFGWDLSADQADVLGPDCAPIQRTQSATARFSRKQTEVLSAQRKALRELWPSPYQAIPDSLRVVGYASCGKAKSSHQRKGKHKARAAHRRRFAHDSRGKAANEGKRGHKRNACKRKQRAQAKTIARKRAQAVAQAYRARLDQAWPGLEIPVKVSAAKKSKQNAVTVTVNDHLIGQYQ